MNENITNLLKGTFEIDLIEIELRKGEISITGKGVIYQRNEELHLKLFNDAFIEEQTKLDEMVESINRPKKTKILEEDDYYSLLGKDQKGGTYQSKVLVNSIASEIITCKLFSDLIKTKKEVPKSTSTTLEIYVNDNKPIPLNDYKNTRILFGKSEMQYFDLIEDAWFFNVQEKYKIQVQRNISYQKILIGAECEITEDEIDKLLDSLRFVLGRYFQWFYINHNSGYKEKLNLRSNGDRVNTIFVPPLIINKNCEVDNYEKLFNQYYAFLSNESEEAKKFNFFVRKTNSAGYSYLGVFELVISVSIEGILKTFKIETNNQVVQDERIIYDVEKISMFLSENFEEGNKLRRRIGGILKSIVKNKISDAKDVLNYLIDKKKISSDYKEVYALRNLFAHAVEPNSNTIERLINLNKIIDLFYHLVFLQIGYTGHYTNYFNDELEEFAHTL